MPIPVIKNFLPFANMTSCKIPLILFLSTIKSFGFLNKITHNLGKLEIAKSNKIIGTINETLQVAKLILSYGNNKNNPCGSKVYKDGMCKRHYNLKNKKNNIK